MLVAEDKDAVGQYWLYYSTVASANLPAGAGTRACRPVGSPVGVVCPIAAQTGSMGALLEPDRLRGGKDDVDSALQEHQPVRSTVRQAYLTLLVPICRSILEKGCLMPSRPGCRSMRLVRHPVPASTPTASTAHAGFGWRRPIGSLRPSSSTKLVISCCLVGACSIQIDISRSHLASCGTIAKVKITKCSKVQPNLAASSDILTYNPARHKRLFYWHFYATIDSPQQSVTGQFIPRCYGTRLGHLFS